MNLWMQVKMFFASFWSFVFPPNALDIVPLSRLSAPPGFSVSVFAKNIDGARSLVRADNGVIFVGTRSAGKVYAIYDKNQNGSIEPEEIFILAEGLSLPNGVAVNGNDLYVAEVSRILLFKNAVNQYNKKINYEVVYDGFPNEYHHGWKFIAFGPDGRLYVPVGAPCNICVSENPIFATIQALDLKTKKLTTIASGVRNTVGFDWHPETEKLYFTDNGRDWLGNESPNDELNQVDREGEHFGYPYCHSGDMSDPDVGPGKGCQAYKKPVQKLGAHVAALGVEFYRGSLFPSQYKNQLFVAEHGSWNRSKKSGYQITLVEFKQGKPQSAKPFITGWLNKNTDEAWGRPVDLLELPTGELLISDDHAGVIYKVSFEE